MILIKLKQVHSDMLRICFKIQKRKQPRTSPAGCVKADAKKSMFGAIRKQKSGRWQASYIHPELTGGNKRVSLGTFQTKQEAAHALSQVDIAIKSRNMEEPRAISGGTRSQREASESRRANIWRSRGTIACGSQR